MPRNKRIHIAILCLFAIAAIIIGIVLVFGRTSIVESVRQESAKMFKYEYIPNQKVIIDSTFAARMSDSIYKDFRHKYRFHYQSIGMASFADSSRMILLSDLPPHFESDSISTIFGEFTHHAELRKHPIGYDGYTTDMIILVGNATSENCNRLIRRLNRQMFLSDYKPVTMALPAEEKRRYYVKDDDKEYLEVKGLDYQISLDEFNTWFLEESESFIHLSDTNTILTINNIFDSQARGVFFSQQPGFVAWAVAKNADIAPQIGDIRQFTLDADLILGALADSNTLIIIGRERQSPLHELPPLQIESILLLAATTEKELSQSLDINDLMAGKMCNGKDWCPTYLSRELENTEFGDLMTITDILLKDWSEHGTIQEAYYRYPEPGYYPFDRPLFRKLGLNELVYNWNTANLMYAIDIKDGENNKPITIYTLGRTGSLPVSYFNSQERSQSIGYKYESQAYHYFATLGNTDLARVVQYTALYQLFIDNNISYSGNTYSSFPKNKPFLLFKPTSELLNKIKGLGNEDINRLADSISQRSFNLFQKDQVDKQLRASEQEHGMSYSNENIDAIYGQVHSNTKAGIARSFLKIKEMLVDLTEEQFKQLARYLSYPRGVTINDQKSYNTYLRARQVNQFIREVGKNNLDLLDMDLNNVKNWYSGCLKSNAGRYLKTSSLIVTFNDMMTTGGHNISSRISRVNSMTNYKRNRGYTPTNYDRKKDDMEPATDNTPNGNKPTKTISPSKNKPTTNNQKTKQSSSQPSTKTQRQPSNKSSVRPRSSVISSAPRRTRGL